MKFITYLHLVGAVTGYAAGVADIFWNVSANTSSTAILALAMAFTANYGVCIVMRRLDIL